MITRFALAFVALIAVPHLAIASVPPVGETFSLGTPALPVADEQPEILFDIVTIQQYPSEITKRFDMMGAWEKRLVEAGSDIEMLT
jgi:hypothetical protein